MTVNEFGCIDIDEWQEAKIEGKRFTAIRRRKWSCEDCDFKNKKRCTEFACTPLERNDGMYVKIKELIDE